MRVWSFVLGIIILAGGISAEAGTAVQLKTFVKFVEKNGPPTENIVYRNLCLVQGQNSRLSYFDASAQAKEFINKIGGGQSPDSKYVLAQESGNKIFIGSKDFYYPEKNPYLRPFEDGGTGLKYSNVKVSKVIDRREQDRGQDFRRVQLSLSFTQSVDMSRMKMGQQTSNNKAEVNLWFYEKSPRGLACEENFALSMLGKTSQVWGAIKDIKGLLVRYEVKDSPSSISGAAWEFIREQDLPRQAFLPPPGAKMRGDVSREKEQVRQRLEKNIYKQNGIIVIDGSEKP
jgi:hypothetical protein